MFSDHALPGFLARLLISILLLWLIARLVPFDALLATFHGTHVWLLALSYLTVPLFVYVDANRTHVFTSLQGMSHSVATLCRISFASSFYSLLVPGLVTGALVRWHRLATPDGKPAQALAVVMFGRLLSTLVTVTVGAACWLIDAEERVPIVWGTMLVVVGIILSCVLWLFSLSPSSPRIAHWLMDHRWIAPKLREKAQSFAQSAAAFRGMGARRLAVTTLLLLANDLLALGSCYLLAVAIDIPLSPAAVGWTRAYVLLLTILPVSVLGFGVREGGLVAMLAVYHVSPASAVAYSTLVGGRAILAAGLGAYVELGSLLRQRARPITKI